MSEPPRKKPTAMTSNVVRAGSHPAVRIPHELRVECDLVQISGNADGDLLIRQLPEEPAATLRRTLQRWPDHARHEFVAAMDASLAEQPEPTPALPLPNPPPRKPGR